MLFLFIFSIKAGVEFGFNQPVIGFDLNHQSGIVYKLFCGKEYNFLKIHLGIGGSYYQGKNTGYSFTTYGLKFDMVKAKWRYAPFFDTGLDYVVRELNKNKETGLAFVYGFGLLVNFNYEKLNLYPAFFYNGLTDFKKAGGNLGMKFGVVYAF